MYRTGRVTELTSASMRVTLDPHPGCGSCQLGTDLNNTEHAPHRTTENTDPPRVSCGGLFSDWFDRRASQDRSVVMLPRLAGIRVGEPVRLDIAPRLALQLAFVAYALPILALIAGAVLSRIILHLMPDPSAFFWVDFWLAPILGACGFIGGLIAYKPLYTYLTGRSGTESSPPLNASRMIVSG